MKPEQIQKLVQPYSPWLGGTRDREGWEELVPHFRRPVFESLVDDLVSIDQIVSVTGPRRVGKTTLLQQLVLHLLQTGVEPGRIVYYSFDDPALFRRQWSGGELLEAMMEGMGKAARRGRPAYLFVDEVQHLERWEQYLKKYYDLKFPVRVVVSGSASSPIFKKSRESLLGRVKDYHLLPFSFREFLLYRLRDVSSLQKELASIHEAGNAILGMFAGSPHYLDTRRARVPDMSDDLWQACERALRTYLLDGGFPEVWSLPSAEKKIEYLYDNQVKKVIYEDLVLATEFRKPEQLKTFYISLLERPGQEVNLTSLSREMGINVQQIDKYLPLLEMTDLLAHAGKFRRSPLRVRKGNRKYYLVDLALRNAVLRVGEDLFDDEDVLGSYAENLVFNALQRLPGILGVDYYREGSHEVDFIVHTRPSRYWPVEVKYRSRVDLGPTLRSLHLFSSRHNGHLPAIVTKNREDHGLTEDKAAFRFPLPLFLLLFDT